MFIEKPRYLRSLFCAVLHDPVSATLAVAAATLSAAGTLQQGKAAKASQDSQAAADDYNASVDKTNSVQALATGTQKELQIRNSNALQLGEERAAAGEAGVGGVSGSGAGTAIEQDTVNGELNALGARYDRDTQSNAFIDKSNLETYSAGAARANGNNIMASARLSALGSIIGGANKFYSDQTKIDNASAPNYGSGGSLSMTSSQANEYGPFTSATPWRNQPISRF